MPPEVSPAHQGSTCPPDAIMNKARKDGKDEPLPTMAQLGFEVPGDESPSQQ